MFTCFCPCHEKAPFAVICVLGPTVINSSKYVAQGREAKLLEPFALLVMLQPQAFAFIPMPSFWLMSSAC